MPRARGIAYKTGTSYGNRDAWSIGYDGRHVLGVWVGRADSGSVPGLSGYESAAPVLFEGFVRSGLAAVPLRRPPAGAFRPAPGELPVTLERFVSRTDELAVTRQRPNPRRGSYFRRTARASNSARRRRTPRRWC